MALKLGEISEGDLKYFAAHALTGLSSNPFLMSPEGKLHLTRQNLTIEKLAMQSALEMISRIDEAKKILTRLEQEQGVQNGTDQGADGQPRPSA